MADFGGLGFATRERVAFNTTAATFNAGALTFAFRERIILVSTVSGSTNVIRMILVWG